MEVLQALGLNYELDSSDAVGDIERPLNKAELIFYKRLKKSFREIKLHQEGIIQLKTIEEVLAEFS